VGGKVRKQGMAEIKHAFILIIETFSLYVFKAFQNTTSETPEIFPKRKFTNFTYLILNRIDQNLIPLHLLFAPLPQLHIVPKGFPTTHTKLFYTALERHK